MKKIYLLFLLISSLSFGQSLGDFIITGYNADAPDGVSFITVVDIPSGTQIAFTDNGWFSAGGFRSNEGTAVWTITTTVLAGTEVVIDFLAKTVSTGETLTGSMPNIAASGDQIFIYDNTNVPVSGNETGFIAAINMDGPTWGTDATSSNNSALPSVFTNGTNAFSLPEVDNAAYNCAIGTAAQTASALRASIYDAANWLTSNTVNQALGTCGLVLPVSKQTIEGFNLYPNPVSNGILYVKTLNNDVKNVSLFNILGKQVVSQELNDAQSQIDVSNLSTGIYILKLTEGNKVATRKVVIK